MVLAVASYAAAPVNAKCGWAEYGFDGSVLDGSTKSPLPDTTIYLFFDKFEGAGSALLDPTKQPFVGRSDSTGVFAVTGQFFTASSTTPWGKERCNAHPETITLFLVHDGYVPTRKTIRLRDLQGLEAGTSHVPALALWPIGARLVP